jgi:sulfate permease, SulP family
LVPLASLAPVLMVVAYNMAEIHEVRHILKGAKSDVAVLLITFFLTVFADLTVAVEFGLLMAAVLFIKRMSEVHTIEKVLPDAADPKKKVRAIEDSHNDCPQATILTVEGALFFGAASKFEAAVLEHIPEIRTLVIRMGKVPVIDATGERALQSIWERCQRHEVRLIVSGLQDQPWQLVEELIGRENCFARTGPAIDAAIERMDVNVCATCPSHVFTECEELKVRGFAAGENFRKEV